MAEMWSFFNTLSSNAAFKPEQFKTSADSIQAELDSVDSYWADWIPFNPTCCTINTIGQKAVALTAQMAQSVGIAPPPKPPSTAGFDMGALVTVGLLFALIVYAPQIKQAFK